MTHFTHLNKLGNINTSGFLNIEKGKKVPIGTIHNGYKKIAEGKWQKVSEHELNPDDLSKKDSVKENSEAKSRSSEKGGPGSGRKQGAFGRVRKEDVQKYFQNHGKHLDSSTKSLAYRDEYETTVSKNQFGNLSMDIKHKEKGHTAYSGKVDEKSELYQKHKHLLNDNVENLDDKEYDDAHVFGKKYSNGASGEDTFLTPKNNEKNPNDNSKKNHEIATKNVERELKKLDDEEKMDKKVNDVVDKFGNYKSGSVGLDKDGKLKLEKSFVSLCDNDSLQKSHIANMFGYGQEAIKIEKTGKDIKAALQDIKTKNEDIKDIVAEKIKTLKSEIGTEPNQECDSYIIEGFEDRLGLLPNKYSWQEIYNEEKCDTNTTVTLENTEAQKSTTCDKKREYNELVNKFVSYSVDILQTDTILNNISDDKKYQLTVKQATILGF